MTILLRGQKAVLYCILASRLLGGAHALAERQSSNCDSDMRPTHVELATGDQSTANHLQLSRKIASGVSINLDVCAADLTVKGSSSDVFQVAVDIGNSAPKLTAIDYLKTLDITPQSVALQLDLPKKARAKVVVVVPMTTSKVDVNLVRGDLSFETDRIRGERSINVVDGHVDLLANADSFANLQVDVVMGSFHDHRKGGEDHRFMVSQSQTGTGAGSIEINVVAGSVDLRPWD